MLRHWIASLCLGWVLVLGACGDDATGDDTGGQGDGGVIPDGAVTAPRCTADTECDNDLYCDGEEACVEGACVLGAPVQCDDGIECTIDRCSEATRECESAPPDLDGDGHIDGSCEDASGEPYGDDCDDGDPLRFPGNIETCDDKDDDCNPESLGEKDSDADGALDIMCCNDGNCGEDCDDLKPSVNPMATEACDRFDNDCDGDVDEGVTVDVHPDVDRDGHGAEGGAVKRCAGTVGFAVSDDDCNDEDPEMFTGQFEICDGKDNNCSGVPDEIHQDAPWFLDLDEDSFGDPGSTPIFSCERVTGRVLSHNDCRDDDAALHPAAAEACDAVDNDCNGLKDFNIDVNDFEDDDSDALADVACGAGAPDCNDVNASTGGGLDEICDQADNDCDDKVDEQTAQTVWYTDRDGDGWGVDHGTALARCEPIPGRASNLGDCRDEVNAINPSAPESCDDVDQDCDGRIDEATDYLCVLPNAASACRYGACEVLACFPGYDDADDAAGNGCETDLEMLSLGPCMTTHTDAECAQYDSDYCNGREVCIGGNCYHGTPVSCDGANVLHGNHSIHNSFDIQQLAGIDTITGDLIISGTNALQTLAGLSNLKVIGGKLIVYDTHGLTSLSGLSGLTTVGDVEITFNHDLTTPDLPGLITANSIRIENNLKLVDIDGFASLVTIHGELEVLSNPDLTDISGFEALRSTGALLVKGNVQLLEMAGFGALERVVSTVDVYENSLLSIAFPKLERVEGTLNLTRTDVNNWNEPNGVTTSISLPELDYVGGHMFIQDYDNLTTLELGKLRHVKNHFSIVYVTALTSLALPSLTTVGGFLISENHSLVTLTTPKLAEVQTDLVEIDPYGVADGDLRVQLSPITAVSFPELLSVDGDLVLLEFGQGTITAFTAPKLHNIGGSLDLYDQEMLTTLSLPALTTIGDDLRIGSAYALTTLSLPLLATIGGDLSINYNDLLTSLMQLGLRNNQSVLQLMVLGSYVDIYSNESLCLTDVDAFIAELVANGFAGTTYTPGNDGCVIID